MSAPVLLVVDDDHAIRNVLLRILQREGYACLGAESAEQARGIMEEQEIALVLTDMKMPGGSGLEILKSAAAKGDVATLMITGQDDPDLGRTALDLGSYGYIIKPFRPTEILINVANALRRRELELENRGHRDRLEDMVRERAAGLWQALQDLESTKEELRGSQEETIQRLSIAAEFRDDETARHVQRMSRSCAQLYAGIGADAPACEMLRLASVMHDVGKIGVPDAILQKPATLTDDERRIMEAHAEYGFQILHETSSELLEMAALVAATHHERYDGDGYPNRLRGEAIPLEGRIAAIADVFDALTTNRIYRRAFSLVEALEIMRQGRGTHFDPDLFDLFMDNLDRLLVVKEEEEERPIPERPASGAALFSGSFITDRT
jgi:putative two-component system response regulator